MNIHGKLIRTADRSDTFAAGAKRIACTLLASALLFAGCDRDEADAAPSLSISPGTGTIAFSAPAGESYTFTVTTNQPEWQAVSDQSWCKVTTDAEAGTFTVTALESSATQACEPAIVTVTAGKAAPLTVTATQTGARYEVYVTGITEKGRSCYWKDGELFPLQVPDRTKIFTCGPICIENNSVYIGGRCDVSACYWKDKVMQPLPLPEGAPLATCTAIAVSDGNVYAAGYAMSDNKYYACYWENGTAHWLEPDRKRESEAWAIVLDKESFYIAGNFSENGKTFACCWKKGIAEPERLSEAAGSYACSIALYDGDVYIAGYCENEQRVKTACYWVNGVCKLLNPSRGESNANAIAIFRGSVRITGALGDGGKWRLFSWNTDEGVRLLPVPDGSVSFNESHVTVCDGTEYVSGNYYVGNVQKACYWIDGKARVDLRVPDGENATTHCIAVMKK